MVNKVFNLQHALELPVHFYTRPTGEVQVWFPFLWRLATRNDAHLSWRVILCVLPIEKPRVLLLWTRGQIQRGDLMRLVTKLLSHLYLQNLVEDYFSCSKYVCTLLKFLISTALMASATPTIGISRMLFQVPRR
jgi:hypothetical protein